MSPDCFEYLKKLEILELHNNPLQVIDQNTEMALGHLKNLQVNYLFFTRKKTNLPNVCLFKILEFGFGQYRYIRIP